MQLNSLEFIFYFLPVFFLVYYLVPRQGRSVVLLAASLAYYGLNCWKKPWMLAVLVGMTCLTYLAGKRIARKGGKGRLAFWLIAMTGLLAFFKLYRGGTLLPPGMSFYLFQMAAFLIDVSREGRLRETGFVDYASKMTMFPKLLSGPLVAPETLEQQNACRSRPYRFYHRGIQQFILGLGMKVLVADRLSGVWSQAAVIGFESLSTFGAWMALLAYSLRLYLDFWGYSLMALGLGKLIGFCLPENFDDPYAAKSVSEFYRRWHITLGNWFREYVYIPMGGNRKGTLRTLLNLSFVWLLTGLWHGTGANYLLWAAILLFFILNERLWLGKVLKKVPVLAHVYTVFVVLLSWVPFAIGEKRSMMLFLARLFGTGAHRATLHSFFVWGKQYVPYLIAGTALATPLPGLLWKKFRRTALADVLLFLLFWVIMYCLATADQSPFLYFKY